MWLPEFVFYVKVPSFFCQKKARRESWRTMALILPVRFKTFLEFSLFTSGRLGFRNATHLFFNIWLWDGHDQTHQTITEPNRKKQHFRRGARHQSIVWQHPPPCVAMSTWSQFLAPIYGWESLSSSPAPSVTMGELWISLDPNAPLPPAMFPRALPGLISAKVPNSDGSLAKDGAEPRPQIMWAKISHWHPLPIGLDIGHEEQQVFHGLNWELWPWPAMPINAPGHPLLCKKEVTNAPRVYLPVVKATHRLEWPATCISHGPGSSNLLSDTAPIWQCICREEEVMHKAIHARKNIAQHMVGDRRWIVYLKT